MDRRSKRLEVEQFECYEIKKPVFPKLQNIFHKKNIHMFIARILQILLHEFYELMCHQLQNSNWDIYLLCVEVILITFIAMSICKPFVVKFVVPNSKNNKFFVTFRIYLS